MTCNSGPGPCEDGMAFVIQVDPRNTSAFGYTNGGIAYGTAGGTNEVGITNSIAVEFDTYQNGAPINDPINVPHIAIHSGGIQVNSAVESPQYRLGDPVTSLPKLNEGPFAITVKYIPNLNTPAGQGSFQVWWEDDGTPRLNVPINLDQYIGAQDGVAYMGFTSSTGSQSFQDNDLLSWSFEYFGVPSPRSTASGSGVQSGVAGQANSFIVQCMDQYGYNLPSCYGAEVTASLSPKNVPFTITDNNDGTVSVSYMTTVAGNVNVTVWLNGTQLNTSPFLVTINPAAVYAPNCFATQNATRGDKGLTGGNAGDKLSFGIYLKDRFGNNITNTGTQTPNATAVITNVDTGNFTRVSGVYLGQGSFIVSYTLYQVGSYELVVSVNNENIGVADFGVELEPGALNSTVSYIYGFSDAMNAGDTPEFYLQLTDTWNNNVTHPNGTVKVHVSVSNPNGYDGTGKERSHPGGLYSLTYNVTLKGEYSVSVSVNGKEVTNSPFALTVSSAPVVEPGNCVASGAGLESTTAGEPASFTVQLYDPYGNLISEPLQNGGWSVEFFVDNSPIVTTAVVPTTAAVTTGAATTGPAATTGAITGNSTTSTAGNSTSSSSTAGNSTSTSGTGNSTSATTSSSGKTTSTSAATTAGSSAAATTARTSSTSTSSTAGASTTGKPAATTGKLGTTAAVVTTAAPAGTTGPKPATTAKPAAATTDPSTENLWQVKRALRVAPSDEDTTAGVVTTGGAGTTEGAVTTGASFGTTGNTKPYITPKFVVSYEADGVYKITYNMTEAGRWNVTVTIDGQMVGDEWFQNNVWPAPSYAPDCIATGSGLNDTMVNTPVSIQIETFDEFGNPRRQGGDNIVVTVSEDSGVQLTPGVTDTRTGIYTTNYQVQQSGRYTVSITLADSPIRGSPFGITVSAPPPPPKPGLLVGADIGIAAGCLVFVVLLIIGIVVLFRYRRRKRRQYISIREIKSQK